MELRKPTLPVCGERLSGLTILPCFALICRKNFETRSLDLFRHSVWIRFTRSLIFNSFIRITILDSKIIKITDVTRLTIGRQVVRKLINDVKKYCDKWRGKRVSDSKGSIIFAWLIREGIRFYERKYLSNRFFFFFFLVVTRLRLLLDTYVDRRAVHINAHGRYEYVGRCEALANELCTILLDMSVQVLTSQRLFEERVTTCSKTTRCIVRVSYCPKFA